MVESPAPLAVGIEPWQTSPDLGISLERQEAEPMKRFVVALVAIVVLGACNASPTGVDLGSLEPAAIAGAWSGAARWTALQGGGVSAVTSGAATATIFQGGSAILAGSTFEVTGLYSGSISGAVDPNGNVTGTATVTVLAVPCSATASFGGTVDGDKLSISASFQNPGTTPCAGAPVGFVLELGR